MCVCCLRDAVNSFSQFSDTLLYFVHTLDNFATNTFYTHWLNVIRDDQGSGGWTTNYVPAIDSFGPGSPNWQSAYPTIIWTMYRYQGDVSKVAVWS